MDDAVEFAHLRHALTTCNFAENEVQELFALMAGLLHLSQISFEASSSSSSSSSSDKKEDKKEDEKDLIARAQQWATSSVGLYANFTSFGSELRRYGQLPSLKGIRNIPGVNDVLQNMRTCENRERGQTLSNGQWVSTMKEGLTANNRVFVPPRGNRTCFQVCE